MSIRTEYRCPHCKSTISGFSKKGYESLHSQVGTPFIQCDRCGGLIATGHKPWSHMSDPERTWERIRTMTNVGLYALLFGPLLGFVVGGTIRSATDAPIWVVILCCAGGVVVIYRWLWGIRIRWYAEVEDHVIKHGNVMGAGQYNHPDW